MFTVLTYFSRETIKVLGQSPILINTLFVPLVFLFASFCIETLVFYSKSFFFIQSLSSWEMSNFVVLSAVL